MVGVAFGAFVDDLVWLVLLGWFSWKGKEVRGRTYHSLDSVSVRACYGNAGTTFGGVVPPGRAEGCSEEVGGECVACEGACSAGEVAAVEGGFARVRFAAAAAARG